MFVVYSKPNCPSCDQAKALLSSKNLPFNELEIDVGQTKSSDKEYVTAAILKEVVPHARSVPQILKDEKLIGGFKELKQLLG